MKIFQKFFKDNQKLNANEIAIQLENNKYNILDKYVKDSINNLKPIVLFDGDNGTTSGITLNDNIQNYTFIEVYTRTNDGIYLPATKVHTEGLTKFQIQAFTSPSTGFIAMNIDYTANNNKIIPVALRQFYSNFNKVIERVTSDLNGYLWNIHIIKVIGYK